MTKKSKKIHKESGVSETIGYIILFGIMTTGIALVTLYGYPVLLNEQANANVKNMERNMIALQSDVKSLNFKNVPYRENTLQISGGVFKVEKFSTDTKYFKVINETGNYQLIPAASFPGNEFHPGQLLFISEKGDILVGLQNGAVVKREQGGSTMLSEPRWFIDSSGSDKILVLIFTQIDSDADYAKSGIGILQMSSEQPVEVSYLLSSASPIRIEYHDTESDYFSAWRNYFNTFSATTDSTVTIPSVKKVIMKFYKVKILGL
jgi:hypothetical protein